MNSEKLIIFVPQITPRIEFSFEFIFQTILGLKITVTSKKEEFLQSTDAKLNYSDSNFSSGLFLKAHSILFSKRIKNQDLSKVEYQGNNLFFPSSDDSFLPFDPFACTFYLLTRYEEYLSESTDEHERYTDSENILVRLNLHQKPIVDQMAYWIADKLKSEYPELKIRTRTFQFVTTIDIDNAWAFKNKSLPVSAGAILKAIIHGNGRELKQRLIVFLGLQKDPYDTYKYILDTYKGLLSHLKFFFLMGDRSQYDKSISFRNKSFMQLIVNLSTVCEIGIHPSYASNLKPWLFEKEKKRLEDILQKPVTKSRQHYLKLKFPKTYHNLLNLNIEEDYTMGFASQVGFRAGTCTAFPFFDLTKNQCTDLIIYPFQIMDVTLKNYLRLNPDEAWELIEKIMLEVRKVNGTFISLWHNESLKDSGQWQGWRQVFEQILKTGLKYTDEQS